MNLYNIIYNENFYENYQNEKAFYYVKENIVDNIIELI